MTFDECIDFIHSFRKSGKKNELVNITKLLELMNNPQDDLKFVHVAGTNGKGSTVTMIAAVLKNSGYNTGLFISPFVLEFRERIQINNVFVSQDDLIEAVEIVKTHIEQLAKENCYPAEFEVVTAIAMYVFKKHKCDIVILEVGLGGLLDVTNVIKKPLVSVITSIGYDHMDLLGDTLEEITFHKCGIIKDSGITVCYPAQDPSALGVIMEQSAIKNNRLIIGNLNSAEILSETLGGTDIIYSDINIHIKMIGKHQISNCITAVETLKQLRLLGFAIKDTDISSGIAEVSFPVRMEIISENPLVIIDGAHNESGIDALIKTLSLFENRKIILIIGMLKDKEYIKSSVKIAQKSNKIIAVAPNISRAVPAEKMAELLTFHCSDVTAIEDLTTAYETAISLCGSDDMILSCGSLYLASDLRKIAKGEKLK